MHPQRAVVKCAVVAPGAVSVMPHEAVSGTSWSATVVGDRPQPVPQRLGERGGRVEHEAQAREERLGEARGPPPGGARGARSRPGRCSRRSAARRSARATVRSNSSGTGLPSSMWSVPPKAMTWPRLWLPPKVWLHGSQSTSTGGSSRRNGQTCPSACWLEHSMRCVLITPFGSAGRARGEQELRDRVRAERGEGRARRRGPGAWPRSSSKRTARGRSPCTITAIASPVASARGRTLARRRRRPCRAARVDDGARSARGPG